MSNYPPGVTGNEDQIAGPRSEREFTDDRECVDCLETLEVLVTETQWQYETIQTWDCPDCGYENSEDVSGWGED